MNLFHNMSPPKKRPEKLDDLIEEIKEVRENVTKGWKPPADLFPAAQVQGQGPIPVDPDDPNDPEEQARQRKLDARAWRLAKMIVTSAMNKISTEDWRGMLDNIEGLNLHPYYQKPQSEPVVEEGRHEKGYPHPSVMEDACRFALPATDSSDNFVAG